ncbi:MAG: LytTR family transcriptional regulator [Crocinitomicaceae bacterium]|nr:LytTR family transcriptional regulator [Crocinitomicaceae bacterium]
MISKKNISTIIAIATGLYAIAICYFFDPFTLAKAPTSINLFLAIGTFSFAIVFTILRLSINIQKEKSILFFSVFILALIIPAIISWIFLGLKNEYFILYITAFFIASIPPTVLLLIWSALPKILNKEANEIEQKEEAYFEIRNSKNRLLFKVSFDRVIHFEANDNYCITHYLNDNDEVKKSMDRISLKSVQDITDQKSNAFHRVHKSHIINTNFIEKVSGKSQAHRILMKHSKNEIPVSRSFNINILEK